MKYNQPMNTKRELLHIMIMNRVLISLVVDKATMMKRGASKQLLWKACTGRDLRIGFIRKWKRGMKDLLRWRSVAEIKFYSKEDVIERIMLRMIKNQ